MAEDQIKYDILTQDALRGVVRSVLMQVYRNGLPGQHHFFIAIDTTAEGVSISKRLKEQYSEEITIVLQYQFWDLLVDDDSFEVKLSFNNIPEKLVVPFSAIKSFFDPSVQFGLQFNTSAGPANDARSESGSAMQRTLPDPDAMLLKRDGGDEAEDERPDVSQDEEEAPAAKVVELDRFRKR